MTTVRILRSAAAATALALGLAVPPAGAASVAPRPVEESFVRPAGTTLTFQGHGFGHGRGMSQWGAAGAASVGLSWRSITDFYYPGTTIVGQGNPVLSVRLDQLGHSQVVVPAQPGLVLVHGSRTSDLSDTATWRLVPDGGGVTLQWRTATGWASSGYWKAWRSGPLVVRTSSGVVRVQRPGGGLRDYRGAVGMVATTAAPRAVNVVPMESYLRSVVPSEMPASWPAEAVRAQAVAARSYAANGARRWAPPLDTCDTTSCQVYNGVADRTSAGALQRPWEHPSSTAAVAATAGQVLHHAGAPAFTEFSSSNGGRSVAGDFPYLVARDDPYSAAYRGSGNPHLWASTVAVSRVEQAYPAVGRLDRIVVTDRYERGDWGGRIGTVTIVGSTGRVSVSGSAFRTALGLRSTWWTVTTPAARHPAAFPRDITADSLPDQLVIEGSTLAALAQTGVGTMARRTVGGGVSGLVALAGPLDQDTLADLLVRDASGTLWLYPGNTLGTFTRGRRAVLTGLTTTDTLLPVGDVTGDRRTDLVTRTGDGRMHVLRGDGTGRFATQATFGSGWNGFSQLTAGDLDGDGTTDLVGVRASDGRLVRYSGSGTGTWAAGVVTGTGDWRHASAVRVVGDLTGDGRHDLLVRHASDGQAAVHAVTGAAVVGAVTPVSAPATGAGWGQ
ncbi:MAG: SpoIID/LytB domain-containing protein [Dermatophilaceae bacterium]